MTTEFSYLGYITLSDNASTMYKSRELKSVALPETEAVSLKLRLHKPHSNAHNVYQQVSHDNATVNINSVFDAIWNIPFEIIGWTYRY